MKENQLVKPSESRQSGRKGKTLAKMDVMINIIAFLSSGTGGLVVESLVLLAAATHPLAMLTAKTRCNSEINYTGGVMKKLCRRWLPILQLGFAILGVLLMLYVIALSLHNFRHPTPSGSAPMVWYAIPGLVAAMGGAWNAARHSSTYERLLRLDAVMAAVTALAVIVAAAIVDATGSMRIDAPVAIAIVIALIARGALRFWHFYEFY